MTPELSIPARRPRLHVPVIRLSVALAMACASSALASAQDVRSRTPAGSPPELEGSSPKVPAPPVTPQQDRPQLDRVNVLPSPRAHAAKTPDSPPAAAGARRMVDHSRVQYALTPSPVAGSTLARGADYKAEFGPSGATFVPFLGSAAPRNYPVTFALDSVSVGGADVAFESRALAVRTDDEVRFERGSLTEVYELSPASVEQRFVFASLPEGGDLAIRIRVEGEFERRECGDALEFATDMGSVRYGRATAIDASGAAVAAPTHLVDAGIEITVPADFLASARFPLTIDPVISTFAIPGGFTNSDDYVPDVAYDVNNDVYVVVFEETYSASDHDIFMVALNGSGATLAQGYIDASSTYWATPRIANNKYAGEFFLVAMVGDPAVTTSAIHGVRLGAAYPFPYNGPYVISSVGDGDALHPDVGGDAYPGITYYCVVWERDYAAGDHDIFTQFVRTTGTNLYGSSVLIDNSGSTLDQRPSISKLNQGSGVWHIAWQREVSSANHDLYAAETRYDGTILTPSTAVDTESNSDDFAPHASSHLEANGHWILSHVWGSVAFPPPDSPGLSVRLMNGASILSRTNVSFFEWFHQWETGNEDYASPCVETDGSSFAMTYSTSYNGSASDFDVYALTMMEADTTPPTLRLSQSRSNLAFSTSREDHVRLVARPQSGAATTYMAVWDDNTGTVSVHDVEAGLYAPDDYVPFCFEFVDGGQCPCGNHTAVDGGCDNYGAHSGGALLVGNGGADLSADSLSFTVTGENPTTTTIFLQGTSTIPGVSFGAGIRCVGGTLKRLYVKTASGGAASAPVGADPSVSARSAALGNVIGPGERRFYMTHYRDPGAAGPCSETFNSSQALQVLWRP